MALVNLTVEMVVSETVIVSKTGGIGTISFGLQAITNIKKMKVIIAFK
jgi:hypothetical protein